MKTSKKLKDYQVLVTAIETCDLDAFRKELKRRAGDVVYYKDASNHNANMFKLMSLAVGFKEARSEPAHTVLVLKYLVTSLNHDISMNILQMYMNTYRHTTSCCISIIKELDAQLTNNFQIYPLEVVSMYCNLKCYTPKNNKVIVDYVAELTEEGLKKASQHNKCIGG